MSTDPDPESVARESVDPQIQSLGVNTSFKFAPPATDLGSGQAHALESGGLESGGLESGSQHKF